MVGAAIEKCRNSTGNVFGMTHFGMVGTERENVASLTENAFDNDMFVWSFQLWQFRVVSGYRRNMGYSRADCRAGVFALLALFLVPTLWGTLLCPLPCYGTDNQRHENHLYVDCPGVGQVARGLRTNKILSQIQYPRHREKPWINMTQAKQTAVLTIQLLYGILHHHQ